MKCPDLFDYASAPRKTRADQIMEAFLTFYKENPAVWTLFQRFALEAAGLRDNYSANAIFERIRWHTDIETRGEEVRLSNNFRAYYARLFHLAYPQHDGFFRIKKLRSEEASASEDDVQVFHSEPPGAESDLTRKLKGLLEEDKS